LAARRWRLSRRRSLIFFPTEISAHLGCTVAYNQSAQIFHCPCHGGEYDRDGNVIAGPPPKRLERINIRVEDDKIVLS
jgi:cytochrome b6-f complex iron-sulfur subunit